MKLSLGSSSSSNKGSLSLASKGKGKAAATPPSVTAAANKGKGRATTTAFGEEDNDDDDNDNDEPLGSTSASSLLKSSTKPSSMKQPPPSSSRSRLVQKVHSSALADDPSVFEYDAVYDSMKAGAAAAEAARKAEKESEGDKPKYVNQLLAAAELRKKDRVRAEDKLIEREREREGDEFRDKEAFVTSAYKEQQAELRKAEEEERIREEQQAKRPGGMAEYYKRELAKSEAVHAAAVAAASTRAGSSSSVPGTGGLSPSSELAARGPKSEEQIAAEASAALGRHIAVNDEGQIIDKRELLTGGLNLKPRKKLGPALPPGAAGGPAEEQEQLRGFALSIAERRQLNAAEELAKKERDRKAREDEYSLGLHGLTVAERQRISRERQSRELERQMAEAQEKKRKADEDKEREFVGKIARRNNDESKVEELKRKALERRLQRQKEQQQQELATAN